MEHTKGKYEYVNRAGDHMMVIRSKHLFQDIAHCGFGEEDEANARRIVQYVNSHDGLVEACKAALNAATVKLDTYAKSEQKQAEVIAQLKTALAEAKKEG